MSKKKRFHVSEMPYATRKHLIQFADSAEAWDFNRQLCPKAIRKLPRDREIVYPVSLFFVHEHRHFMRCEPHMRLMIGVPNNSLLVDVPMDNFDALPMATHVRLGKTLTCVLLRDEAGAPVSVRYATIDTNLRSALKILQRNVKDQETKLLIGTHLEGSIRFAA